MSNEKETITARFKNWVAGIGWALFLWGSQMTEEEYWATQDKDLETFGIGGPNA